VRPAVAPDPAEAKAAIRKRLRALRAQAHADPTRRAALSQALLQALAVALSGLAAGRCLAGYMPLPSEADPMAAMAAHSGPLCLPVVAAADAPLIFRAWRPGQPLQAGLLGTLEPPPGLLAGSLEGAPLRPDVVIVPLVGFDQTGGRLGQGGGYYDRTLAALRASGHPVLALGLGYQAQQVPFLPLTATDMRLDMVVTEAGLHRFGPVF
jgi:5-formyltetrahydrofolate cyclo-ligase